MPKSDMMYMVKQNLISTGNRLLQLAETIGEDGNHLSENDRKLVKMAMIPVLEEQFSELVHFYIMDNSEGQQDTFRSMDKVLGLI